MGFHTATFGLLGLSLLELGRGTRQTERRTDGHRPSFYNFPTYGGRGIITAMQHCISPAAYATWLYMKNKLISVCSRVFVRYRRLGGTCKLWSFIYWHGLLAYCICWNGVCTSHWWPVKVYSTFILKLLTKLSAYRILNFVTVVKNDGPKTQSGSLCFFRLTKDLRFIC